MTTIKDPIHGYIKLTEREQAILDSVPLQKLRHKKQLGNSSIVYPSATHSRFSHTIGVLATAEKYAQSLELKEEYREELRMAALFHDTGHGPYSHLAEEVTGLDHEQRSCQTVEEVHFTPPINKERIKKIIKGELEIGQVIHGDVDADRLDYLQRDAYFTGVDHGQIESETIIQNTEIDSRRLVYNQKAVPALENLLVAREHMTQSVYYHHTSRIADKMMARAMEDTMNDLNRSAEWLMRQTDRSIYDYLKSHYMMQRIEDRALYKRAYKIENPDTTEKKIMEILLSETELNPDNILVDHYDYSTNGPTIKIKEKNGEIKELGDLSNFAKNIGKNKDHIWIYTDYGDKEKIQKTCHDLNL